MKIRDFTLNGSLMALVIISTLLLRIPTPTGGHLNLGDAAIFISALCLGGLRGGLIGGIGSALADLIGGHFLFVIPTLIIKFLEGFVCGVLFKKFEKYKFSTILSCIIGSIIMAFGYFIFEYFALSAAVASMVLIPNFIQGFICSIISLLIYPSMKKMLKNRN